MSNDIPNISLETCREIAVRIWCDPEFSKIPMYPMAVFDIADILKSVVNRARRHEWDQSLAHKLGYEEGFKHGIEIIRSG